MNLPVTQLVRVVAANTAAEAGRQLASRGRGMGFLNDGEDYFYDPYGDFDYLFDYGGNYGGGGGGGNDLYGDFDYLFDYGGNYGGTPTDYYMGLDYGYFTVGDTTYTFNPDDSNPWSPFDPIQSPSLPSYRDITGSLDYRDNIWDWLTNLGPGLAPLDPQYGPAGTGQGLPKACYGPTYHPYPIGHPQQDLCVPYPPNDQTAKKRAQQQKQAQQQVANAAKKAQQQQDKACPKHPQGLPVWRNPQTGKCEVVPPCTSPAKFDSTTRQCLTPQQAKELYGDNNWWLWALLIAGGVLVISKSGNNSGGRR